jgi:hypothetical protein
MHVVDQVVGTALILSGPGTQYEWLQYLYAGMRVTGIAWDELPLLRDDAPAVIGEKLPRHFAEQRPWRYRIEERGENWANIVVSPSINKGGGWWHNDGIWRVRAIFIGGIAHNLASRQRLVVQGLIDNNDAELTHDLISFRDKLYGPPPLQT